MADVKPPEGYSLDTAVTPPAGYKLDPPGEKSAMGFLGNALLSAGAMTGDAVSAVAHPLKTLDALGSIPVGLYEKAGGPVPKGWDENNSSAKSVDSLFDHFKQRYGSIDNAKETFYNDPAGFMGDLSMLFGGAGAAADAARLPTVGKVLGTASAVTDPLRAPVAIAGAAAGKVAEPLANTLTRDALKGGYAVNAPADRVAEAVATARKYNVPLSENGIQKISGALGDLRQQIIDRTGNAARGGATIDPKRVEARLGEVRQKFGSQVNRDQDLRTIDRSGDEFLKNNSYPIPIDDAQQMKVGTYQQVKDKYGKASTAQIESEKALARGIKEEIEAQIPEMAGINDSQSKLINLDNVLGKAVNKYVNGGGFMGTLRNEMFTMKGSVTNAGLIGAGAALHDPILGGGLAVMQSVLSDPAVKMALARGITMAQRANPGKYGKAIASTTTAAGRIDDYAKSLAPKVPVESAQPSQ